MTPVKPDRAKALEYLKWVIDSPGDHHRLVPYEHIVAVIAALQADTLEELLEQAMGKHGLVAIQKTFSPHTYEVLNTRECIGTGPNLQEALEAALGGEK